MPRILKNQSHHFLHQSKQLKIQSFQIKPKEKKKILIPINTKHVKIAFLFKTLIPINTKHIKTAFLFKNGEIGLKISFWVFEKSNVEEHF